MKSKTTFISGIPDWTEETIPCTFCEKTSIHIGNFVQFRTTLTVFCYLLLRFNIDNGIATLCKSQEISGVFEGYINRNQSKHEET